MKAPRSLETSGTAHPVTQRHVLADLNPQQHRCENLRSHSLLDVSVWLFARRSTTMLRMRWLCECVCPQEHLRCPCCLSCLLAFLANPCLSCLLAALPNLLTSTCLPALTKEVSQIWQHCSHTVICHNSQQMHAINMLHKGHDCLSVSLRVLHQSF
jgi:hypothetical protein